MPSVSRKQRKATVIALKHPEKLFKRNWGLLSMTQEQLHEFASKKEKGLPLKKKKRKKKSGYTPPWKR